MIALLFFSSSSPEGKLIGLRKALGQIVCVQNAGSQIFSPGGRVAAPWMVLCVALLIFLHGNHLISPSNLHGKEQRRARGFGQHVLRVTAHPRTETSLGVASLSPGDLRPDPQPDMAGGRLCAFVPCQQGNDSLCLQILLQFHLVLSLWGALGCCLS